MKTCNHPSCTNPVFSKGMCKWHVPKKLPKTKPRKHILPVSPKQLERQKEYRRVRDIFMADHPVCQAKQIGCTREATDCHHVLGKTSSLLTDARYFKALCRNCHNWTHDNPAEARKLGLLGKSTEGFIINKKAE